MYINVYIYKYNVLISAIKSYNFVIHNSTYIQISLSIILRNHRYDVILCNNNTRRLLSMRYSYVTTDL